MTGASLCDATVTIASVDKGDPEKWAVRMLVPLSRGGRVECKAAYTSADRSTREIFQVCPSPQACEGARESARRGGGASLSLIVRESSGFAGGGVRVFVRAGVRPCAEATWYAQACDPVKRLFGTRRVLSGHVSSCTNWTRLVLPSVLSGHVSSRRATR